jgi:hypothetical protein
VRGQQRRLEAKQPHVSEQLGQAVPDGRRLSVGKLKLEQPPDVEVAAWQALGQAREADRALRPDGAQVVHLLLEPGLELVDGDRHGRVTADC